MTILILNQAFHPDVVATAQHATDLALELRERGHEVTVVAGRQAYGCPRGAYPAKETWKGIRIRRVGSLRFGKRTRFGRAINFASFLGACLFRLAVSPRFDVVVAMTSPPMLGFLAALFARARGGKLVQWVMDLNPDEAIAAGWLRDDALLARLLERMSAWSMDQASHIVVLDRFMRDRIEAKIDANGRLNTVIIPPGARDQAVRFDAAGRDKFRRLHGLAGKFVIMYSGNHSPCHPLDTVLGAAERLKGDPRFVFCFVGGGSQFEAIRQFADSRQVGNILTLPYQPEELLSASLSAADLHVVVMGDPFVGIVHPSKIYNVLTLGIPILYIGPPESHITDLAPVQTNSRWFFRAPHGDVNRVVAQIASATECSIIGDETQQEVARRFSHRTLLDHLCACVVGKLPSAAAILESGHERLADTVEETGTESVSSPAEPLPALDGADSRA